MNKKPVSLVNWENINENKVKLIYSDGRELVVSREDFDRTFITFVTSPPEVIARDFCNEGVENK